MSHRAPMIVRRPAASAATDDTDLHALETAIGQQVRNLRVSQRLTVSQTARVAGLSPGMLSKIENGSTSPSLTTLRGLATALNVPVTLLFARYEDRARAVHVRDDRAVAPDPREWRPGWECRVLGDVTANNTRLEPLHVTMSQETHAAPWFEGLGVVCLRVLDGELEYHHGPSRYHLTPGDTLVLDAATRHAPGRLIKPPVELFVVRARPAA